MSIYEQERRMNRMIAEEQRPKTYLQLMEKVGDSGKYQKCMLLVFSLLWFVTGIILLSTAFLFRSPSFDCRAHGLLLKQPACTQYVCTLDQSLWEGFLSADDHFHSLATSGNYLCDNSFTIDLVSSCTYLGALLGYIAVSFYADNYGRKRSLILAWIICAAGTIIVATSFHISMAAVGFFLSGFGSDASINICLFFFGEAVGTKNRQKYSIIVQIFFALGALVLTLFFFIFQNWRVVWCLLVAAPALIGLILVYCYIEETPEFLVKLGTVPALQALNRIGKINLDRRSTLQQQDVQNVIEYQMVQEFKGKLVTPLDLCRFSSLRIATITCSCLSFVTYAMYYGPALIIDQVGFNIFISSTMIQLSQLVVYFPALAYIDKLRRKRTGIILFSVASFVSFILVFLERPEDCETCYHSIIELVVVFIFRGCVSLFFCFFQVYMCELYPARIRAIGMGLVSSFGTLATTLSPICLGFVRRHGLNAFNVFLILGIIAIGCLVLLPQTKGRTMTQQIQQIQAEKQRRRSLISIKSPKIRRRDHKSQITYDKLKSMNLRMIQSNRYD